MNQKIARFFEERRPATPCLVLDLDVVAESYRRLEAALPDSAIYYAVKANPAPEILRLLASFGSCFDTASLPEIEQVLAAGATADRVSYGKTITTQEDNPDDCSLGLPLFPVRFGADNGKDPE